MYEHDVFTFVRSLCSSTFKISEQEVMTAKDQKTVACRKVMIYLMRRACNTSYPMLGQLFNRNHSTMIHHCDSVTERMVNSREYRLTVEAMLKQVVNAHGESLSLTETEDGMGFVFVKHSGERVSFTNVHSLDCDKGTFKLYDDRNKLIATLDKPDTIDVIGTNGYQKATTSTEKTNTEKTNQEASQKTNQKKARNSEGVADKVPHRPKPRRDGTDRSRVPAERDKTGNLH